MSEENGQTMTFWDHLDELRKVIFRSVIVVAVVAALAFIYKEFIFGIVFAPHRSDFITYRLLCQLGNSLNMPSLCPDDFQVDLINTELTAQFMTHMSMALYAGMVVASPYLIYLLFRFISPALYESERKYSAQVIIASFFLFIIGVLLNYYVIFPLSFRFLGTYQVSEFVVNKISLSSYISTFTMLSIMMGAVFEIPVLAFFLGKMGIINTGTLKQYRRHAFVAISIVAAIITPTADIFTLLLVTIPMYMLYELSIVVVKRATRKTAASPNSTTSSEEYENPYHY